MKFFLNWERTCRYQWKWKLVMDLLQTQSDGERQLLTRSQTPVGRGVMGSVTDLHTPRGRKVTPQRRGTAPS